MTRMLACIAWTAIGFSAAACQRGLAGAPCPCVEGWVCCTATDVCQLTSSECPNNNDAGDNPQGGDSLANCWSTTTLYEFDNDEQKFAATPLAESTDLKQKVTWDGALGYANAGSLLVRASFTDVDQKLLVSKELARSLDLTGQVVTAYVLVDQDPAIGTGPHSATGGTPDHPAVVSIYAKTGTGYHFVNGPAVNLTPGGWKPLVLDLANPNYMDTGDAAVIDPADVRELGLHVSTAELGTFSEAILHVDSFTQRKGTASSSPPWTFDCGSEGFAVEYISSATIAPTIGWSSVAGNPSPGSLELTAAFSGPSQEVGLVRFVPDGGIDFRGKTLSANVRLVSGLSTDPDDFVIARLYISAGPQHICGIGPIANLAPGSDWAQLTLSVDKPHYKCDETQGAYDPSTVRSIGVIIKTASVGTFIPATVLIDSITARP